ncbi:hypothetical protein [Actinocrinis sp.]|uniref:hypothetical protein n=1 Tax=Actinocrinis sp. TaxID=1920516 RepID=UPI002D28337C|nr:hypothetical protein [Actinocrinis sp.]HZP54740.1 hypothetical protein [Actinocrinis sp.]
MLLLGLLLLCATGAFTGLLIAYNTGGGPDYTVTMFGNTLGTFNSLEIFIAGLALALIFCFSLFLMFGGAAMARRRRVARRAERREARAAMADRDAMAARLEERDAAYATEADTTNTDVAAEDTAATTTSRRHHRPHVFGH